LGILDQIFWYDIPKNMPCQESDVIFFGMIFPKYVARLIAALAVFRYITRRHHHDEAIMVVFSAGELSSGR
jgi:hypothetical protein